jgi:hypothetical protein
MLREPGQLLTFQTQLSACGPSWPSDLRIWLNYPKRSESRRNTRTAFPSRPRYQSSIVCRVAAVHLKARPGGYLKARPRRYLKARPGAHLKARPIVFEPLRGKRCRQGRFIRIVESCGAARNRNRTRVLFKAITPLGRTVVAPQAKSEALINARLSARRCMLKSFRMLDRI